MVETITTAASPALDHIIERPRLIAHLAEGGGSRVSVLAAPAGYGKTTLARQWSQRQDGPVAWYRTTRASGDVALLAVQLDDLLASIAPELPREEGKVAAIASVNASPKPLGRAILRTFETLSEDVLLVVDEWEAAGTNEAEELLSMLVEGLGIRFLITTRTRPDWFTPRLEVYREGLEIGVDELAMTDDEAAKVLTAVGAVAGRARLMRTAEGWPAVLGLAAMSGDVDLTSSRLLSHTLYEFLASELLAAAPESTQTALMLLAVASVTDVGVARELLGRGAGKVIDDAVAHGLLAVTEGTSLSLHPLLRELLIQRFAGADAAEREALLTNSRRLLAARRWDEALSVAEVAQDAGFATEAIGAALDDLLAAGRTSSLERWVAAARAAGAEGGLIDYAESEALLRADELDHAMALATQAAGSLDGDLAARAHLVAGRAAQLLDRPRQIEYHAKLAAESAETEATREGTLWLAFLQAIEEQTSDLTERLDNFRAAAKHGHNKSLMIAAAEVGVALIEGGLTEALDRARGVRKLATTATDPIAHTGFLCTYSYGLAANAQYQEALESIDALSALAESSAIDFAAPYAQMNRVKALIGLRKFAAAARVLAAIERQIQDDPGAYFHENYPVQRARLHASVGDADRALEFLSLGPGERSTKTGRSEFLAWQALLSAIVGNPERVQDLSAEARSEGRGMEAKALTLLAEAICALRAQRNEETAARVGLAMATEVLDPFVIAVRAAPQLGAFIAGQRQWRSRFQRLLVASCDSSLARTLGLSVPREARGPTALSPREAEVHELLAQGMTNEEIAKLLYISLSTTKVHVKHIYDKLGVRSRLEAARALRGDV